MSLAVGRTLNVEQGLALVWPDNDVLYITKGDFRVDVSYCHCLSMLVASSDVDSQPPVGQRLGITELFRTAWRNETT